MRFNIRHLRDTAAEHGDNTDEKIARRVGISKSTMSRLVNEHNRPRAATLEKLCSAYPLAVEELYIPGDTLRAAA